jgi:hypothetical protein
MSQAYTVVLRQMIVILRSILDNQEMFEQNRWAVKADMASVLQEANDDILDDEWKLPKIAVEAIVMAEAEKQSNNKNCKKKKDYSYGMLQSQTKTIG